MEFRLKTVPMYRGRVSNNMKLRNDETNINKMAIL